MSTVGMNGIDNKKKITIKENKMKYIALFFAFLFLSGCSVLGTKDYTNYVEASKSVSKDNTIAQTACFNAVTEIAKSGDAGAKVGAIALAEKCKSAPVTVEAPKKGWFK